MRIISGTTEFEAPGRTAVAIGKFDGVHLGHKKLLEELLAQKADGLLSCVFTFEPSPEVYFGFAPDRQLSTRGEKRKLFASMGIDLLIEFPFDGNTAAMPAEEFIRRILAEKLHAAYVVAGADLSFGDQGSGNFELLTFLASRYGYETRMIPKAVYRGKDISSTLIRSYVSQGKMEDAAACLGSPYMIRGEVMHGNAIGRTIDIPTLNLIPEEEKLMPPYGVYYSIVNINEADDADPVAGNISKSTRQYYGMTNIGMKPTIHEENKRITVETYVYDFDEDAYGKNVTISLLTFRRPEMKFDSMEELQRVMMDDVAAGRSYHGIAGAKR